MVQTNLIEDTEIRKGVEEYLKSKQPVPELRAGVEAAAEQFVKKDSLISPLWA